MFVSAQKPTPIANDTAIVRKADEILINQELQEVHIWVMQRQVDNKRAKNIMYCFRKEQMPNKNDWTTELRLGQLKVNNRLCVKCLGVYIEELINNKM